MVTDRITTAAFASAAATTTFVLVYVAVMPCRLAGTTVALATAAVATTIPAEFVNLCKLLKGIVLKCKFV